MIRYPQRLIRIQLRFVTKLKATEDNLIGDAAAQGWHLNHPEFIGGSNI
jgi:hypothetical protein